MKQISFLRLIQFSITASIILTLIAFIFNIGIASATVQYSESFFFSGANVLSEVPVAGVGVAVSTNITGAIDKLQVDFDDGKVIDQIQAGNGSFALTTGARVIPKLSASLDGVNLNLTNFDAYVANTLYGYGVIGWQRLGNNNYTYIIDFDYVDEAYAATLTGQTTIGLIYDDVVFTGITATSATSGAVTNTYNYAAIEGSINSGGFGQRSATYVAEPTYIYFEFTDTATVTANNISSSYAYINLTKSGVNYGFNITNASGGEFYGVTSVNDVSQLLNFTQGISFNLHHIGLDSWANRTIFDATGNLSVGPIPPTVGEGGSPSGQITYNFDNATVGETYGINANITSANFTAFTTYYIYGYDVYGNIVTGFPISFSTQNYSTGKFWTFNLSGNYNATLRYCGILECVLGIRHDLDTASVYIPPPSYTYSVTTDAANYQPGGTIIITASNPSPNPVYITAYGETGIIDEIAWNTLVPAGVSTSFTRTIPAALPLGTYTINMATTISYAPIVAQATFNISSPANTSGILSVLWEENLYLLGRVGALTTTSGFNTSRLTITSPGGISITYDYPALSTNNTLISLNEVGTWKARIADNGNASNYSQQNTTVIPGNPTDNETLASCMVGPTYVCWDQHQYEQGEAYTINFKQTIPFFALPFKPYIQISNPSNQVIFNQSINSTYDPLAGIFVGSLKGSFSPNAQTGVYFVRMINYYANGEIEPRGESAAEVIQRTTAVTPSATGGAAMQTQTDNFLSSGMFIVLIILILFAGAGLEFGGMGGAIIGFGAGFIFSAVYGLIPLWALFLFAIVVILCFAMMLGKDLTQSGGGG